jgi:DNA (cytosine-5)-methyltransferase 1
MADAESECREEQSEVNHAKRALVGASVDAGRGTRVGDSSERGRFAGRYQESSSAGAMEAFPVYPDVRTFDAAAWRGKVDVVSGGFPCQPHSQAGKRLGGLDDRDLWPDTVRILRESGAPLGFFENVPGLLTSRDADGLPMFGRILGDLSESGFDAEWCVLGADDVGAPHRRKRLWILAYRHGDDAGVRRGAVGGEEESAGRDAALDLSPGRREVPGGCEELPDAESQRWERSRRAWDGGTGSSDCCSPWAIDPADVGYSDEPGPQGHGDDSGRCRLPLPELDCVAHGLASGLGACVPRVAVGVPDRVPRLRALGNGQVPLAMAVAWTLLARRAGI